MGGVGVGVSIQGEGHSQAAPWGPGSGGMLAERHFGQDLGPQPPVSLEAVRTPLWCPLPQAGFIQGSVWAAVDAWVCAAWCVAAGGSRPFRNMWCSVP